MHLRGKLIGLKQEVYWSGAENVLYWYRKLMGFEQEMDCIGAGSELVLEKVDCVGVHPLVVNSFPGSVCDTWAVYWRDTLTVGTVIPVFIKGLGIHYKLQY